MSGDAHISVSGPSGEAELTLPWSTTVGELLENARQQLGLNGSAFELSCADGVSMMNKLERTLQELRDRRICPTRRFVVKRERNGFN